MLVPFGGAADDGVWARRASVDAGSAESSATEHGLTVAGCWQAASRLHSSVRTDAARDL